MTSPRSRMLPDNPILHDADREQHEDLGIRAALRGAGTAAT